MLWVLKRTVSMICLFDLILNVHSTIFQLCGTGLPGLNQYLARINVSCSRTTTQWRRWGSNPWPFGLESSTLPLSHCAPHRLNEHPKQILKLMDKKIFTSLCLNILLIWPCAFECRSNVFQLNSYKPSVLFVLHRQTMQSQIRHSKIWGLIRVSTIC